MLKEPEEATEAPLEEDGQGVNNGWKLPQVSDLANSSWMKTLVKTVKSIAQEDTTKEEEENTEVILPKTSQGKEKCTLPNVNNALNCII